MPATTPPTTPPATNTHARRIALITGGGSGIGLATATRLARSGYCLALVGRRKEVLAEACRSLGPANLAIAADLADPAQAESAIDTAVAHFGRLDVLVNNAGWSPAANIPQTNAALASRIFAINAVSPAAAISRIWPVFERQYKTSGIGGCVVSISSMASFDPFDILYAYGGAKASLNNLTISVARQGAAIGVRAFCIAPGAVETPLLRSIVSTEHLPASNTLTPDTVAQLVEDCIRGRRDADNGRTIPLPNP